MREEENPYSKSGLRPSAQVLGNRGKVLDSWGVVVACSSFRHSPSSTVDSEILASMTEMENQPSPP